LKPNEIGHFPYRAPRNEFDNGGYPKLELARDEKGNVQWDKNDRSLWIPTWKSLGEVTTIQYPPEGININDCIYDLQAGSESCYYAANVVINNHKYIYLLGNGWADCGFPFHDDSFDPAEPHKTGKGCYALLRYKARENFKKQCENGTMTFQSVFTGDVIADFVLPAP